MTAASTHYAIAKDEDGKAPAKVIEAGIHGPKEGSPGLFFKFFDEDGAANWTTDFSSAALYRRRSTADGDLKLVRKSRKSVEELA